ncbi:MAG TPA: enoyl-CoA hydratase/isomerase family protein [Candidatus Thermoplasmatota archaeon]|nr:enoyl-CoA hydratase/isomerase family protein [Candidatus Thermoplasmatota archaeon]
MAEPVHFMATTTVSGTPAASTKKLVNYSVVDGVAVLELDDPPANTYTHQMMRDLDEGILQARFDENVHVIVITGKGDKFFSAGANISMLNSVTPYFKYNFCLHANETLNRLMHTPKLVIAALNGHTVGGGLEIAMACDMRIARKDGGKIGLPEVNLGVLPGTGGTQRLLRLVGAAKAIELMVEGRNFSFEEAKQMGVVNYVFEGDAKAFREAVLDYARQFCPPNKASMAVGHIKRSVQSGQDVGLEEGLVMERELQNLLFKSEDAKEGIAAYVGKKVPNFRGK